MDNIINNNKRERENDEKGDVLKIVKEQKLFDILEIFKELTLFNEKYKKLTKKEIITFHTTNKKEEIEVLYKIFQTFSKIKTNDDQKCTLFQSLANLTFCNRNLINIFLKDEKKSVFVRWLTNSLKNKVLLTILLDFFNNILHETGFFNEAFIKSNNVKNLVLLLKNPSEISVKLMSKITTFLIFVSVNKEEYKKYIIDLNVIEYISNILYSNVNKVDDDTTNLYFYFIVLLQYFSENENNLKFFKSNNIGPILIYINNLIKKKENNFNKTEVEIIIRGSIVLFELHKQEMKLSCTLDTATIERFRNLLSHFFDTRNKIANDVLGIFLDNIKFLFDIKKEFMVDKLMFLLIGKVFNYITTSFRYDIYFYLDINLLCPCIDIINVLFENTNIISVKNIEEIYCIIEIFRIYFLDNMNTISIFEKKSGINLFEKIIEKISTKEFEQNKYAKRLFVTSLTCKNLIELKNDEIFKVLRDLKGISLTIEILKIFLKKNIKKEVLRDMFQYIKILCKKDRRNSTIFCEKNGMEMFFFCIKNFMFDETEKFISHMFSCLCTVCHNNQNAEIFIKSNGIKILFNVLNVIITKKIIVCHPEDLSYDIFRSLYSIIRTMKNKNWFYENLAYTDIVFKFLKNFQFENDFLCDLLINILDEAFSKSPREYKYRCILHERILVDLNKNLLDENELKEEIGDFLDRLVLFKEKEEKKKIK